MAGQSLDDRIDNVAPGDIIALQLPDQPETGSRDYKVVHKDHKDQENGADSAGTPMILLTLEGDDGETIDVELPADSVVNRSLESKWESAQSPTPHQGS